MKKVCALSIALLATPACAYDGNTQVVINEYQRCLHIARDQDMRNICTQSYNDMINTLSHDDDISQYPPMPPPQSEILCLGYGGGFTVCY